MKRFAIIAVVFVVYISGCGGSGVIAGLIAGDIVGPDSIIDLSNGIFSISVSGDAGITYLWSCKPENAGQFENKTSAETRFTANAVTAETAVEIIVVINSDNYGPVIKTSVLSIEEFPEKALLGNWTLTFDSGDLTEEWPSDPMEVSISRLGETVDIILPDPLLALTGDPEGFHVNVPGGHHQEARSNKSWYGGYITGNDIHKITHYSYRFEYNEDIDRMTLRVAVPDGGPGMSGSGEGADVGLYFGNRI